MKKITPQKEKQEGVTSTPAPEKFAEILARIPEKIMSQKVTASICDCPMCDCQTIVSAVGVVCSSCQHEKHSTK